VRTQIRLVQSSELFCPYFDSRDLSVFSYTYMAESLGL
jgi:hypothetical protein